ncbi:MAG: hypothetical protein M1832_005889 [Thelocarpon impressellum]|nr:MAG: hypothetical protein M1832_005889 [Thelocarpon impressellum]
MATSEPFYVRYYSGHSGKFGHEFLEFDFRVLGDGRSASARYANNSNYRNDSLIRKEMCVSGLLVADIKRIIKESEIMKEDDTKWPEKNRDGRQELEIRLGNEHISFETAKIGSLVDVTESADPEGLRVFYYLVQDLKALVFSLISLHFKSLNSWRPRDRLGLQVDVDVDAPEMPADNAAALAERATTSTEVEASTPMPDVAAHDLKLKQMDIEDDTASSSDISIPLTPTSEVKDGEQRAPSPCALASPAISSQSPCSSMSYEFSEVRLLPNTSSSFLRAGSKFHGTQQSDKQVYDVQVELKHVDMDQSFLCGYLRIQGLTEIHPTLTTYFEGEIIGDKYSFQTKHPEWGSNDKVDMQHWGRFNAWRYLGKSAKKPDFAHKNFAQRENVFMRWKEHFLVPDHRVRTISGASFEGFYYICFNQVSGTVSGIYFHASSAKWVA